MAEGVGVTQGGANITRRWLTVAGYVAVIFIVSAQPGLHVPGTFAYRDKIAHILEYGGLGYLVWLAARDTWPTQKPLNRALLVLLACMALGAIDERFQAGIPGRESSVYDWLADSTGALLAQLWGLSREMRREVG
ncbi:MAG TPA: VanZ family protein [Planctomycetota bacterium]|nr:VanZ family protein [Planctomycetota bacterium]